MASLLGSISVTQTSHL